MSRDQPDGNGHPGSGHSGNGHPRNGHSGNGHSGNGHEPDQPTAGAPRKVPGRDEPRPLPKRFYTSATVAGRDGGFAVELDGRPVKTPAKRSLNLPTRALAEAVAAEFSAQGAVVDPATMPVTRIVNSALDGVAPRLADVAADVAKYAGSDLVCYRADGPQGLLDLQARYWDPMVEWAERSLGVRPALAVGIMPVTQPPRLGEAVLSRLAPLGAIPLAAMHVMTTLTGSALLALAYWSGELAAADVWSAAHVDEDWQISQWGEDAEAAARRAIRRAEFDAAALVLDASR